MLFGEAAETGGGLVALALAAGGGVGWLLQWLASRRKDQRAELIEDQKRDAERWSELYERIKLDRDNACKREETCQAALTFARSQMAEVRIRSQQKTERILYLEELLDHHEITHRKWNELDIEYPHPRSPESHKDPELDHDT